MVEIGEAVRARPAQIERYGAVAQAFHWLIAALILFMLGLGYYMEDLPLGLRKLQLYNLHKSIGISIAMLAALRLLWRLLHPPPPLPTGMRCWERKAAGVVHALLYLMLFVQPLVGFLQSNAVSFPVVLWGLVPLPPLIGPDERLGETLLTVHTVGGNFLALLVILHVGAALRHHFVLKDDVLRRMLPGPAAHR
ncbi:MAG TPA: cytochrome b [Geminicoccaceae bacterium]|nr:cytochrome b [Geminicoccaceae bacterium]